MIPLPASLMGYVYRGTGPDGKDIYTPPDVQTIQIVPGNSKAPISVKESMQNSLRKKLLESFDSLNIKGQQKAVERVDELAEIPKYKK